MSRATATLLIAVCTAACTAGCMLGRNYTRPPVDPPDTFRGAAAPGPDVTAATASIADHSWQQVFTDDVLRTLIATALKRNYDVQLAAARILEAQAQLGVTRADQFPNVSAGVDVLGERPAAALGFPVSNIGVVAVQGSVSWEIDVWGKYRRATEAARAQLLATEWGRRAVITTLISQVAGAYFGLRALDLQLDITRRTLGARQESLRLTQVREQGGAVSLLDVRQAEQLVYGATAEIATFEREIEQQENYISLLLGNNPAPISRGAALVDQPHPPGVPVGLPSQLLERRPDIQQAEAELIAANAQIAVARAAYFPNIALTGSGGFESTALATLFTGTGGIWMAALSATQPIFTAGRIRSQVAVAEARQQEDLIVYQRTIRQAFREVSDALVGYRKLGEFRDQEMLLFTAAQDALRLAEIRYQGGATSYLEVLDADTRLFDAELSLAQARLSELLELVEIYRALGGGWQS